MLCCVCTHAVLLCVYSCRIGVYVLLLYWCVCTPVVLLCMYSCFIDVYVCTHVVSVGVYVLVVCVLMLYCCVCTHVVLFCVHSYCPYQQFFCPRCPIYVYVLEILHHFYNFVLLSQIVVSPLTSKLGIYHM